VERAWSPIVVYVRPGVGVEPALGIGQHRHLQGAEVEGAGAEQRLEIEQHVERIGRRLEVPAEGARDLRGNGKLRQLGIGGERTRAVVDRIADRHQLGTVRHGLLSCGCAY